MTSRDEHVAATDNRPGVAQVIGTFAGGGAQRLAYNLALGASDHGWRSIGIATREVGYYGESGGTTTPLIALGADVRRPLSLVKAALRFRALVRCHRIDVVHVHGAPSLPFVVAATRMLSRRPKIVFTWQDSESVLEPRQSATRLMIWALRHCARVSGSSRQVAAKLSERAGIDNVGIFHGGVPVTPEPDYEQSGCPLIVWLGRIVPPKDPQILIRAAARLRDAGFRFQVVIIGKPTAATGWYMEETRALIDKLALADIVNAPGFLADEDVADIFRRAEIGVQTSHTEGMSIALMENMMAGLAIVATDVGDTSMAIKNGVSGLLIEPREEDQLVAALERLLKNTEMRVRISRGARLRAVEGFSIQAMVARAAAEYVELVARPPTD